MMHHAWIVVLAVLALATNVSAMMASLPISKSPYKFPPRTTKTLVSLPPPTRIRNRLGVARRVPGPPHETELARYDRASIRFNNKPPSQLTPSPIVALDLIFALVNAKRALPASQYYTALVDTLAVCRRHALFDDVSGRSVLTHLRIHDELKDAITHLFLFDNWENNQVLDGIVEAAASLGYYFGDGASIQETIGVDLQ
jgi:hypothetical protein